MNTRGQKRALLRLALMLTPRDRMPTEEEEPLPVWPGYRVEHRLGDAACLVGYVPSGPAHHATLTPFIPSVLTTISEEGELVLIDEATDRVVARRSLRPDRRRA